MEFVLKMLKSPKFLIVKFKIKKNVKNVLKLTNLKIMPVFLKPVISLKFLTVKFKVKLNLSAWNVKVVLNYI